MADLLTAAMCVYMITPFRCGQPARPCTAEEGGTGSVSQDRIRARSVGCTNNRSGVREFLISRRGKVTPERVGLAAHPGTRRVPGSPQRGSPSTGGIWNICSLTLRGSLHISLTPAPTVALSWVFRGRAG